MGISKIVQRDDKKVMVKGYHQNLRQEETEIGISPE